MNATAEYKWISNETQVNLSESRCVWDNGKDGDPRVELWADKGNVHVWAETNGDPVYGEDSLTALLVEDEGLSPDLAARVVVGDLSDFES